jgi:hypothetical protein
MIFFVAAAGLLLFRHDSWWIYAAIAVLLSQYLIFTSWHDARFGTIANGIMVVAIIISFGTWSFSKQYKGDVATGMHQTALIAESVLTEKDLQHLPEPVRQYLRRHLSTQGYNGWKATAVK